MCLNHKTAPVTTYSCTNEAFTLLKMVLINTVEKELILRGMFLMVEKFGLYFRPQRRPTQNHPRDSVLGIRQMLEVQVRGQPYQVCHLNTCFPCWLKYAMLRSWPLELTSRSLLYVRRWCDSAYVSGHFPVIYVATELLTVRALHSFFHSIIHSFIHSFIYSFIYSSIQARTLFSLLGYPTPYEKLQVNVKLRSAEDFMVTCSSSSK